LKKFEIDKLETYGVDEHPVGAHIPEAGNSELYETGSWRTFRPVIDFEKCIQCLYCFIYCPDSSIRLEEGKVVGIDYKHCKGCGICSSECPRDAIEMKEEIRED